MPRRAPASVVLLLLTAPLAIGCYTRHVRQDVFDDGGIEVFLRSDRRNFSPVEKGYDHPVTISSVRMAHILSRLDVRKSAEEGGRRVPAIPTNILYAIADGMSRSFSRAGPDQDVVVMAVQKQQTLRIFGSEFLTALLAYVRGDQLFIHLARTEWPIPERRNTDLPQPRIGDQPTKLRLYPDTAMTLLDSHSVAIRWRDPIFSRPTRTRILPSGEVVRKTILLESAPDADAVGETGGAPLPPEGLSPGQLRALADLEEQRLSGQISEAEYRMRQQEILNAQ